jgi:hypothetical protein
MPQPAVLRHFVGDEVEETAQGVVAVMHGRRTVAAGVQGGDVRGDVMALGVGDATGSPALGSDKAVDRLPVARTVFGLSRRKR